ncbi:sigma-70 family RNA polymerase sigma factor [[Eubacterium] hominis]|uniref:sigma-70 family RNA polymerase sigma factor n=1 Tax=[Eubacterium] hominis TaxID=2764325 RepID=UPI003A4E6758
MQIEKLNDNELIYMARQRNEQAFHYLMEKYRGEIYQLLRSHLRRRNRYQDMEDFYQLALVKLYEAIEEYKTEQSSFHHYYFNILKHTAIDMLRAMNTYNARKDLYCLSLDMQIEDHKGTYTLLDIVEDHCRIEEDHCPGLYQNVEKVKEGLNELELEIFRLRSLGGSYQHIADELGITKKKVDNTLRKIRRRKNS